MRGEIEAFMKETGMRAADLCRRAGLRDPTLIHRTLHRGTTPTTQNVLKLREAMASYRAEIAKRMEKAEAQGRKLAGAK